MNKSFYLHFSLLVIISIASYLMFPVNASKEFLRLFIAPFVFFIAQFNFTEMYNKSIADFNFESSKKAFRSARNVMLISVYIAHFLFIALNSSEQNLYYIYLVYALFTLWNIGFGNYIQKVERNYVFGIQMSWTLQSEKNWHIAHRFASKIMMLFGICLIVIAFFISPLTDKYGKFTVAFLPVLLLFALYLSVWIRGLLIPNEAH